MDDKQLKIGVFGTCRIQDWNFNEFQKKTNKFPLIYANKDCTVNVRPLGYTTTASDVLQNLDLVKSNRHSQLKKNGFLYENIFLTHNGGSKTVIFDMDYDVLVIEICSIRKLYHIASNLIFPYCALLRGKEVFYEDLSKKEYHEVREEFDETVQKIQKIQELMNCKIVLVPPITEFDINIKDDVNHCVAYRNDIIERLKIAQDNKNIYFINWNDFIKEKGRNIIVKDQFHFTDYGGKEISKYIYNFILSI